MLAQNQRVDVKFLSPGDTVAIAAPSSPFRRVDLNRGVDVLKAEGYRVHIPDGIFEKSGYLAGSDRHRADQLHHLFEDPQVKAIVCARGGYGAMRIIPYLNPEIISANPKPFFGFSDVTALLCYLYDRCGRIGFHGPMVTTLANAHKETRSSFFRALASGNIPDLISDEGVVIRSGCAAGPLIGGNLTTLCHLTATPFQPSFSDHILFLEDVGEKPYRIDRMLTQMKLAGCFDGIRGLCIGTFKDCGRKTDIEAIVDSIFEQEQFPILSGFGIGHSKRNFTIGIGAQALLDTQARVLSFNRNSHFLDTVLI